MKRFFQILFFILFFQLVCGNVLAFKLFGVEDPNKVFGVEEPAKVFGVETDYSDACTTAGCTGTYEACTTFDYSGDTDESCINSGGGTIQGTITGATIQEASALGGTAYGVLLDIDNERVSYALTPTGTIWEAGWVVFSIETPATLYPTGDQTYLFRLAKDASNEIRIYAHNSSANILATYQGAGGSADNPGNLGISTSTIYTVAYSWQNYDVTDKHCACIQTGVLTPAAMFAACSGSWNICDTEALDNWNTGDADEYQIGDPTNSGIDGSWNVDNIHLGLGYEGD